MRNLDRCTYYKFVGMDRIGKYDPDAPGYYLLDENGDWIISGAVMRWVYDAAYDYIILDNIDEVKKFAKRMKGN